MFVGLILTVAGVAGAASAIRQGDSVADMTSQQGHVMAVSTDNTPGTTPIIFDGNGFKAVYMEALVSYPNVTEFDQTLDITGNTAADQAIRAAAEARGFIQTRIPLGPINKTGEQSLTGDTDDLLQPLALAGWQQLKAAASEAGIPLQLISAYRSPQWQRGIFTDRLAGNGATPAGLAAGQGLDALDTTLRMTSIPGYSRHHTGYTVDFSCKGYAYFETSPCAAWLEADNYLAAKQAGWIPSYPEGADEQGPEPEAWEYVWVGRHFLFE